MKITKERSGQIRIELLRSAANEINRVGFASITMAQVAANYNVTVSTINNRFRNKFELVDALVTELLEPTLGVQLDERAEAFWSGKPPTPDPDKQQLMVLSELVLGAVHSPDLRPIVEVFLDKRAETASKFRDQAVASKRARPGLDPHAQLTYELATFIGHSISTLVSPPPPRALDQIEALIQLTLLDLPATQALPTIPPADPRTPSELPTLDQPLDAVGQALVDSTRTIFAQQGYEGSNLQEIARATGHTTGTIYARFAGKAELMRVIVLESVAPASLSAFNATRDLIESLGKLDDSSLGKYVARLNAESTKEQRALRLVARDAARREPVVAEIVGPLQDIHIALLADVFRKNQAAGQLRNDLDPEALAWWIVCFPVGVNLLSDVFPATLSIDWTSVLRVTSKIIQTSPA